MRFIAFPVLSVVDPSILEEAFKLLQKKVITTVWVGTSPTCIRAGQALLSCLENQGYALTKQELCFRLELDTSKGVDELSLHVADLAHLSFGQHIFVVDSTDLNGVLHGITMAKGFLSFDMEGVSRHPVPIAA
ncbi:MAG TPA: hypothetical protein VEB60_00510 [Candidatus Paceibacterota bacterium]|nr:hypothetical protein [Candidatus Paceibacterota bacterium]